MPLYASPEVWTFKNSLKLRLYAGLSGQKMPKMPSHGPKIEPAAL
jgi:hypothetical protein